MSWIEKLLAFYNSIKGIVEPAMGILLGSFLTYFFTFSQVKKNNKFVVLKEIKQELMTSMDFLHKKINIVNMKSNDFHRCISAREYSEIRFLNDETLLLYNEIVQIRNLLISNYELLNSIYKDYLGKTELSNIIFITGQYLEYYNEKVYSIMSSPTFCQESYVSDGDYLNAIGDFTVAIQDDFKKHYQDLANSHVGKVVEFINTKLTELVK